MISFDKVMFKNWLESQGFTVKSSRDILSRIKRADEIVKLPSTTAQFDEFFFFTFSKAISKKPGISLCVRSQLKRAVKLLNEFLTQ
jgi:hypothetical protein